MWYFAGFNGFGQFGSAHAAKVLNITSFEPQPPSQAVLSAAWSYNAYAQDNQLTLRGFVEQNVNGNENIKFPNKIKTVRATDKYCLVLLESGQLFRLSKDEFSLQHIKLADSEFVPRKRRRIFQVPNEPEEDEVDEVKIQHLAFGTTMNVAITSNNSVYNIPSLVHRFPSHEKIISLQCGFEHALALTANGDVYAWGNGLRGQLGAACMSTQETPTIIEALAGIKIVNIAANGWHSAAVSSFGDLYVWGSNCDGQLGIPLYKTEGVKNPSIYHLPQVITLPICSKGCSQSCNAVEVFCGARHTFVKTSCGLVLACGWNNFGQLALNSNITIYDRFSVVEKLPEGDIDIVCGPWCTIFKVNQKQHIP